MRAVCRRAFLSASTPRRVFYGSRSCLLGFTSTGSVCWFERAAALGIDIVACPRGATFNVASATLEFVEMHRCGTAARPIAAALETARRKGANSYAWRRHPCRPRILVYKVPNRHRPLAAALASSSTKIAPRTATREATKTPKPAPYAASSAAPASGKTRARPCRRARAPPPGPHWKNRRTRLH